MNQEKKEYTLDDLEDIIREYSSPRQANDATVRLGDTRPVGTDRHTTQGRTKPLPEIDGDVRIYSRKASPAPPVSPDTVGWEPQYDEPMGQYTPPSPITFPQNREQLLRRKLERIEQQYQSIDKAAPSRMRAGLLLHLLLFLAAAGTTLLYRQVDDQRLRLMIFGQILVMLLSATVGYRRLLSGVTQMLHRRFTLESMLAVTLLVCWIDALLCLKSCDLPFSAVFSMQMLMAQWAEYQRLQTRISRLDTLRKATELGAVVKNKDYYKHQCAYQQAQGDPQSFIQSDGQTPGPKKRLRRYALAAVALGGVLAVVTAIIHGAAAGVRVYAAALLAATPASMFVCIERPMAVLEKRMHKLGSVLCGWTGVQAVEKQGYYPLAHEDLFPAKHVKLNGVRFYGERNPNTVVSYVAALMKADGGSLAAPFEQLRSSRNARMCKVEELTSYPGGVGGQIDGLSVVAGTLEFIEEMGVELSDVSRIPYAVYAAVNQSLCAVFAVNFSRSKSSASGLRTLCDSGHVHPILVDCDFVMTDHFLEQKLGVNARRMHFPDVMTRMNLAQKQPPEDAPVIALTTRGGLAQRAYAVTGASALNSAWRYGTMIHLLGGTIGFLAVVLLALKGATALLTPYNLLLYGCVWMIPGMLMAEWTRNI